MSETEDRRGILGRVKDVFFEAPAPKEAAQEEDDSPAAAPAAPEPPTDAPAAGVSGAGSADFDAAYALITRGGDPKTDQVLGAYADMTSKGLDGPPLVTAMTSLIRAVGADAAAIAGTVTERRQAVAAAIEAQRGAMQGRIAEMAARTESVVAAAENEIGDLEERIKNLRGQVAEAQVAVRKAEAGEHAAFTAFERQATLKKDELHAFAEFLAGTPAAP